MRILVVEDQKKMAGFLKKGLSESGYSVDTAETGALGESLMAEHEYDLVILDGMLPEQDGFETAKHMRRDGYSGPILMLTALSGTKDKVHGLDAGADDYLTKPFAFEELLARIRALLRRKSGANQGGSVTKLQFEDLELDLLSRQASRAGTKFELSTKEFGLLEFLMRNPNRVLSRMEICENVWDIHFDPESNVVDVYINMLRKKIDQPFDRKLIQTVVGAGYVLRNP